MLSLLIHLCDSNKNKNIGSIPDPCVKVSLVLNLRIA